MGKKNLRQHSSHSSSSVKQKSSFLKGSSFKSAGPHSSSTSSAQKTKLAPPFTKKSPPFLPPKKAQGAVPSKEKGSSPPHPAKTAYGVAGKGSLPEGSPFAREKSAVGKGGSSSLKSQEKPSSVPNQRQQSSTPLPPPSEKKPFKVSKPLGTASSATSSPSSSLGEAPAKLRSGPRSSRVHPPARGRGDLSSDSVCREVACEGLSTSAGYCRLHYIKNWKKLKKKELILRERKLNQYIEELVAKYPDKYVEAIRQDLASDKDFAKVISDLDLDEAAEDFDVEGGEHMDGIIDHIKRDFDDDGDIY